MALDDAEALIRARVYSRSLIETAAHLGVPPSQLARWVATGAVDARLYTGSPRRAWLAEFQDGALDALRHTIRTGD